MATINGILKAPNGSVIPGAVITFRSTLNTSDSVISAESKVTTDETGKYAITINPGNYLVTVSIGIQTNRLGMIQILPDTPDGDLNILLIQGDGGIPPFDPNVEPFPGFIVVPTFADIPPGAIGFYVVEHDETHNGETVIYAITPTETFYMFMNVFPDFDKYVQQAKGYADAAKVSADNSEQSAELADASATNADAYSQQARSSAADSLQYSKDSKKSADDALAAKTVTQQIADATSTQWIELQKFIADSQVTINQYLADAEKAATDASTSAGAAATSAGQSSASASDSANSATAAKDSETKAKTSEDNAASSESSAAISATEAIQAKDASEQAKDATLSAKDAALAAKDTTLQAKDVAVQAQQQASGSATAAAGSASSASGSAASASVSATAAAGSATAAKTSETNSKTSETNAKSSETAAAASAGAAKTSETNSATSASKAKTSETNAAQSETDSAQNANQASASATAAKSSETNAKTSETNAKSSEDAAQLSKTAAAGSASSADTSSKAAKTSETNAKTYSDQANAALTKINTTMLPAKHIYSYLTQTQIDNTKTRALALVAPDLSTAINNAMNDAVSNGYSLFFPTAFYTIRRPLIQPLDCQIFGSGTFLAIASDVPSDNWIWRQPASVSAGRQKVLGLTFDASEYKNTGGMYFNSDSQFSEYRDITIRGCEVCGMRFSGASSYGRITRMMTVSNIFLDQCGKASTGGLPSFSIDLANNAGAYQNCVFENFIIESDKTDSATSNGPFPFAINVAASMLRDCTFNNFQTKARNTSSVRMNGANPSLIVNNTLKNFSGTTYVDANGTIGDAVPAVFQVAIVLGGINLRMENMYVNPPMTCNGLQMNNCQSPIIDGMGLDVSRTNAMGEPIQVVSISASTSFLKARNVLNNIPQSNAAQRLLWGGPNTVPWVDQGVSSDWDIPRLRSRAFVTTDRSWFFANSAGKFTNAAGQNAAITVNNHSDNVMVVMTIAANTTAAQSSAGVAWNTKATYSTSNFYYMCVPFYWMGGDTGHQVKFTIGTSAITYNWVPDYQGRGLWAMVQFSQTDSADIPIRVDYIQPANQTKTGIVRLRDIIISMDAFIYPPNYVKTLTSN